MKKNFNISIIAADTPRLRSYIFFLKKNNFKIEKIYFLKKNEISKKLKFVDNNYFDNSKSNFNKFLNRNKKKIVKINSKTENNRYIINDLKKLKSKYIIFSSNPGDILKKDFFNLNKKIVHVHPGLLPMFKGSTPYYYQILKKKTITFSSMFMSKKLDAGQIICDKTIKIKYLNKLDLINFDEVYDPFFRGVMLINALKILRKRNKKIYKRPKKNENYKPYFVIHPVLKFLSLKKGINEI